MSSDVSDSDGSDKQPRESGPVQRGEQRQRQRHSRQQQTSAIGGSQTRRPAPGTSSDAEARPAGQLHRHYPPPPPRRPRKPPVDVDDILARRDEIAAATLAELEAADAAAQAAAEARARLATTGEPEIEQGPLDLTDIGTLKRLLRRHGLRPNKSFGQHLLISRKALGAILAAAELGPEDSVLEVGAGTGVLTVELAQRVKRVVAVELDQHILPVLRETTARYPTVEIIPRDLLDVQPTAVFGQQPYKLVANLPYYITALTLRHFLEAENPPREMVVMVQREVAERMTAVPGDLSLLGLSVQFYTEPEIVASVPAGAFFPPPQVESAIVRLARRPAPLLAGAARDEFFRLAHAGFAEKRKQIHNSLARNLRLPQETVAGWLAAAGIDAVRRAETLALDDWVRLTEAALAAPGPAERPQDAPTAGHAEGSVAAE